MLSKTAFNRMKKAELVEWALETQRTAGEAALFAEEDVEEPDRTEAEDRCRAFLSELETLHDSVVKENKQLKTEIDQLKDECMTPSLAFVTMKDQFRRPGGKIWGW